MMDIYEYKTNRISNKKKWYVRNTRHGEMDIDTKWLESYCMVSRVQNPIAMITGI